MYSKIPYNISKLIIQTCSNVTYTVPDTIQEKCLVLVYIEFLLEQYMIVLNNLL